MNGETMSDFQHIVGRKIIGVRNMTQDELDDLDWYGSVPILVLDNGTEILASQDDEGNGAGRLWIYNPNAQTEETQ